MTRFLSQFPLIYLALVIAVVYFNIYGSHFLWLFLLLFLVYRLKCYPKRIKMIVFVILIAFAVLFLGRNNSIQKLIDTSPSTPDRLLVQMDSIQVNGNQLSLFGKHDKRIYQCFYQLPTESAKNFWQNYDGQLLQIEIKGTVERAEGQRNLNGFDYRNYLKSKGISQLLAINQISKIKTIKSNHLLQQAANFRRKVIVYIQNHFDSSLSSYMQGLLLGYLPKAFSESLSLYSMLGIIHLFAISGMQVAFFINKLHYILQRLGVIQEHLIYADILFSLFYMVITGFQVSIMRALFANLLSYRNISSYDNFAITFIIIILLNPLVLIGQSAQLSFLLAFILLQLKPIIQKTSGLLSTIKIGIYVSLGILPLLLFYFYEWQPLSIVLTILFSFLFDYFILPLLVILLLLSPLPLNFDFNFIFLKLEELVIFCSNFALKPVIIGKPEPLIFASMLFIVYFIFDAIYLKRPIKKLSFCFLILVIFTKWSPFGIFAVVDVGQGDCIVIQAPFNLQTIVVDVGGKLALKKAAWQEAITTTNAEKTLLPFLKSRGISHIDYLVATHADADHIGDLAVVAETIRIKNIALTSGSLTQGAFKAQLSTIKPAPKFCVVKSGDALFFGRQRLNILYPSSSTDGGNNDSIVLYGKLWGISYLLTGDLESQGELELITKYPNLTADVLKVGHHGSQTSSSEAFIQQLQPKIAIISCGANNRYNHPHLKTLQTLIKNHVTIKRTDKEGMIYLKIFPLINNKGLKTIK
ncbi:MULTISPECIES: DNA internalization-related competence protein ComEC/Rec2 [unclassified Enterococcus]|uniref:DNA internalization-related competence protein ComEC/Rec2 n=1 Tax=unclassified Enterococcus TaxID=2608891 RepID=UPI00155188EB|nr:MULTISPECIES: DNA internalization-related competence protein ComEC/Rec2 [unclassified Enterococcus]MBS7576472.1 DNA internalization-related competence protein ComEC/Rec2 [Enterococcus sp. MMGLQ5-2]MBS7583704.1 DNA internalization-related competence protein ComEC/Rec2 [Enterococcus sp. MMGLQ5-1]NPD11565.1 DNA internalization-related competence protein ComEC/Rec2 [Enterococcus sp. MMGLQ5-1]NPD36309.1 DNA internalization-related competence protein ComEC/Rec2 [Enterococcus sp. MMGLQ5-2]